MKRSIFAGLLFAVVVLPAGAQTFSGVKVEPATAKGWLVAKEEREGFEPSDRLTPTYGFQDRDTPPMLAFP